MNFFPRAVELADAIITHRRWLHQHPEPSFEEKETTAYIIKALEDMGVEVISFPDYYGAIGVIKGEKPGKTVMLRADIDALPMEEHSGDPFAATNGYMHSCGHDCHAAMLLGAAKILTENREILAGTVKLLFQSGEEGFTGARYYVDKGHLSDAAVAFGMHVWGHLPAPAVNIEDGARMAACDNFKIVVSGYAAHGSTPHLAHDVIMAASAIIMNLQTFASRENDPLNPLVITIGTVKSGSQFNIIPDTAVMEGTVRSFTRETGPTVESGMRRIIGKTAEALGCKAELIYDQLETTVVNEHIWINDIARKAAINLFGEECLVPMNKVSGSEDFSYFMEHMPGIYVFLGCLNEELGIVYPNHSDKFRVDESILHRGAALYAQFAHDFLTATGGEK